MEMLSTDAASYPIFREKEAESSVRAANKNGYVQRI